MDAFFASVEQLDNPELRGKPVIVGGPSKRGVVTAASYEARPFGVRSAMPMSEALRRCPHAIVVPGHMDRYAEVSRSVFAIFRRYTPWVEGLSVDEAFLDVTDGLRLLGDGERVARDIKDAIRTELGLTASAGVAPCKFAAKIASDFGKPDGLVVVPEHVALFLAPLELERMWGVGKKASAKLRAEGFKTIGDLARADPKRLETLLGSWGANVHALANGIDDRPVLPGRGAKSVGAEQTYATDLVDKRAILKGLLGQSARVAARLVDGNLSGQVVTVKLKYADFIQRTRQMRLPEPIDDTDSIYNAAKELVERFPKYPKGIRLTGVSVSDLETGPPPANLFEDEEKTRRRKVEAASQALRKRFGKGTLTRGALLEDD